MKDHSDPYYKIFLIPSGMVYERLSITIADLSKAYHASNFVPHVTLLGNLFGSEDEITLQALPVWPVKLNHSTCNSHIKITRKVILEAFS